MKRRHFILSSAVAAIASIFCRGQKMEAAAPKDPEDNPKGLPVVRFRKLETSCSSRHEIENKEELFLLCTLHPKLETANAHVWVDSKMPTSDVDSDEVWWGEMQLEVELITGHDGVLRKGKDGLFVLYPVEETHTLDIAILQDW